MPGAGGCRKVTPGFRPVQGEREGSPIAYESQKIELGFFTCSWCDSSFAAMGDVSHAVQVMRLDFLEERNCLGFILCNIGV